MNDDRPRIGWWIMVGLAGMISLYAFANAFRGAPRYPAELKASFLARPWGIRPHAFFAGVALILGPFQFHRGWLRNRARHRTVGKLYLASGLMAGAAGLYMAPYSYGGMGTHLGFGGLALVQLTTLVVAYRAIKSRQVAAHREWMIRSYGMIYAGVMLRLQVPLLMIATQGDFLAAYRIVAWLCWVPNLIVAELIVRRTRPAGAGLPVFES